MGLKLWVAEAELLKYDISAKCGYRSETKCNLPMLSTWYKKALAQYTVVPIQYQSKVDM